LMRLQFFAAILSCKGAGLYFPLEIIIAARFCRAAIGQFPGKPFWRAPTTAAPVEEDRRSHAAKNEEVIAAVDDILKFAGLQGARTLMEHLEDDTAGRQRVRVRVVRGEGKRDWVYDVLVEPTGLLGIYRSG